MFSQKLIIPFFEDLFKKFGFTNEKPFSIESNVASKIIKTFAIEKYQVDTKINFPSDTIINYYDFILEFYSHFEGICFFTLIIPFLFILISLFVKDYVEWQVLLYTSSPLNANDFPHNSLSKSVINSIRDRICGLTNNTLWYFFLGDHENIKLEHLEKEFISIGSIESVIYLLGENGIVWKFNTNPDVKKSERFYSLSGIPPINRFLIEYDQAYFVGNDGSLWREDINCEITQLFCNDVINVFCSRRNFVLCENGKILKSTVEGFSEILCCSSVVSIQVYDFMRLSSPILVFLLENGYVYYGENRKVDFLVRDIKSITICGNLLYSLTNDGELLQFAMSDNFTLVNRIDCIKEYLPLSYPDTTDEPALIIIDSNNHLTELNKSFARVGDTGDFILPGSKNNKSARK